METSACTINLILYLSVNAGLLCKQRTFKIQGKKKFYISRAGVLSVLFLFSFLQEIPNWPHSELMRFLGLC